MFKFLILSLAVVTLINAIPLTDEQKEKLKTIHSECKEVSGVDDEVIKKSREGEFTDDPKFKEHILCVSKKIGFQNEAGEIQKDVIKTKLSTVITDAAKVEELVNKCAVQQDTPEATAFETLKCYHEATHTE